MRGLAIVAASAPFAFGLIRLIRTETDGRYLVVAAGAIVATVAVATVWRRFATLRGVPVAVVVLPTSTLGAMASGACVGTSTGLDIFIVAVSFGACYAGAAWLYAPGTQ